MSLILTLRPSFKPQTYHLHTSGVPTRCRITSASCYSKRGGGHTRWCGSYEWAVIRGPTRVTSPNCMTPVIRLGGHTIGGDATTGRGLGYRLRAALCFGCALDYIICIGRVKSFCASSNSAAISTCQFEVNNAEYHTRIICPVLNIIPGVEYHTQC